MSTAAADNQRKLTTPENTIQPAGELIKFPNTENSRNRWQFLTMFNGTGSFWKLVAFFSVVTYGIYFLSVQIALDLITANKFDFDLSFFPLVYGITALVWALCLSSALVATTVMTTANEENKSIVLNSLIASAMLAALALASNLLYATLPEYISEYIKFDDHTTLIITVIVFALTSFFYLNSSVKIWKKANNYPVGAWISGTGFIIASVMLLRFFS